MKWLKWVGIALGTIILILAVVPLFISLDDYIPRIEQEISARIKEPVKIGSLRAGGLPLPHVTVSGVTVGKTDDIKVGKVTVTPDLWSLLSSTKVIKSIEIERLVLTQKAIDKIPAWTKPAPGKAKEPAGPPPVRVESIRLDDAVVKLQKATFGPFDAKVSLTSDGNPESASIETQDGKLKAFIKPDKSNYLIDAVAKGWTLPVGPPIHFDELTVKGVATLKDAALDQVRARLYGGTVAGKASAAWQKGVQVKGSFDVNQVELKNLVPLFSRDARVSGRLNAKPVFSASARDAGQLANALRLETPFDVRNGVVYGVDVKKAATSLLRKNEPTGGETRFDKLTGHLVHDRGTSRFTKLDVVSGALAADGNVTISPKQELTGRINANVKAGSVSAASVPLNVAGTVQSPLLYPTTGTLAGAAAGTAILGPGLGTSVGAKIGQWTEGLFGKKEEEKK
ncbi:MAG: AsmA family protein [Betaproteobacteria bacterium]|nr:AsmA family protein [Betaproteobacteria bacterium]